MGAAQAVDRPEALEGAIEHDRGRLRARLRDIVSRPEVRDALFVASPSLDDSIGRWIEDPAGDRGQKVERAIVRYFSRMCTRPTPFGLFAGCSVGTVGERTRLAVAASDTYERHSRLDMDYLHALTEALTREPAIRESLSFRPNSSLYRAAGRLRFVETRLSGERRSHHLVAVEDSEHVRSALSLAERGVRPSGLAGALVDADVTLEDAERFVDDLIESQLLVPDLAFPVTGPEPLDGVLEQLEGVAPASGIAEILGGVRSGLASIDVQGLGVDPERYRALTATLEDLPAKVEPSRLFQVDMIKPAPDATLGERVVEEILRGVELLRRLGAGRDRGSEYLDRFREAFAARYEGREVPLVEALDEDVGVGFDSWGPAGGEAAPLLRALDFPVQPEDKVDWGDRERHLLRMLTAAVAGGVREVVLGPTDVEAIAAKKPASLPGAAAVTATIVGSSAEAIDRGDFTVVLESVVGPSGARLLGRFCHADPVLRKHVEEHLRAEEALDPEAVFAEVVHLPEGRLGNILARPVLREYEIPYLGRSGAPPERRIPVTDLLVSVVGGRIVLRSRRLGRRVIPRLTSAHNFTTGVDIYRFLCLLQADGVKEGLGWGDGPLRDAPFFPRLRIGRMVLSLARWRVDKAEIERLSKLDGAELFRAATDWRAERGLPRTVALADYDNRLVVDLENVLSLESFARAIQGRDEAVLLEVFPGPDELCAKGPEGLFAHEVVIPVIRTARTAEPRGARKEPVDRILPEGFRRSFPPGSEWLYASLFTGTSTADRVLLDVVAPLARDVVASGEADRWFFIRYGDSGWHLRIRFHGVPEALRAAVLPKLELAVTPLIQDGRLSRFLLDTYEREVERYGGPEGIDLAEQLFHADSDAVIEILEMVEEGDEGHDERWRLALAGSAAFLSDLGLSLEEKATLMERLRREFQEELGADARLKRQIGERYRKERAALEALLDPPEDGDHPLAPGFDVLRGRSERLAPIVAELRGLEESGRLWVPVRELAQSYVHMHVNRLIRSAQRAHELVLYDFLARLFHAEKARRAP